MTGNTPDWLTRTPIAHRGLHGDGLVENSLAAVEEAIDARYAVEVDLQLTADGGLAVIHDATLSRTAERDGRVADYTLDELRGVPLRHSDETVSSLTDLLALTSGRAALFMDLKAPKGAQAKAAMAAAITRALAGYSGAAAVMTFDPDLLAMLRPALPNTPLGILAGGLKRGPSLTTRVGLDFLLHTPRTKPDFVGYYSLALPHPGAARQRPKRKVLAWTVRSQVEADQLAQHVDQIIFEGFRA